ncbi:hypothetical protein MKEN_00997600 [Mycena kentingensis (nom. inval.)]|nr:hypothetical protein MKEN_00997600 [Mycena kentingensis (nom. inval.)]
MLWTIAIWQPRVYPALSIDELYAAYTLVAVQCHLLDSQVLVDFVDADAALDAYSTWTEHDSLVAVFSSGCASETHGWSFTSFWQPHIERHDIHEDKINQLGHVIDLEPRQQLFPPALNLPSIDARADLDNDTKPADDGDKESVITTTASSDVQIHCVSCVSRKNFSIGVEVFVEHLELQAAHVNISVQEFVHRIELEFALNGDIKVEKSVDAINLPVPDLAFTVPEFFDAGFFCGASVAGTLLTFLIRPLARYGVFPKGADGWRMHSLTPESVPPPYPMPNPATTTYYRDNGPPVPAIDDPVFLCPRPIVANRLKRCGHPIELFRRKRDGAYIGLCKPQKQHKDNVLHFIVFNVDESPSDPAHQLPLPAVKSSVKPECAEIGCTDRRVAAECQTQKCRRHCLADTVDCWRHKASKGKAGRKKKLRKRLRSHSSTPIDVISDREESAARLNRAIAESAAAQRRPIDEVNTRLIANGFEPVHTPSPTPPARASIIDLTSPAPKRRVPSSPLRLLVDRDGTQYYDLTASSSRAGSSRTGSSRPLLLPRHASTTAHDWN